MLVPFYLAPPSASAPVLTLTPDDIAAVATAVWATMGPYLLDLAKVHGLVPAMPLVVTSTSRNAGDVNQTVDDDGLGTVTVTRV